MERAGRLRRIAESGLGIVLATTPVLLWVAWTPELLIGVMLAAVLCAVLLVLLTEPGGDRAGAPPPALPPEFVDEVQRLFPLTYHHSMRETARFRRAMKRLSRLIAPR
jgi:hypothetical protein